MTKWFKTIDGKIIPIDQCKCFWIEGTTVYDVFIDLNDLYWIIGRFEKKEEALKYIDEIHQRLIS